MTKILHKRGSGEPAAESLDVGEIALDTSAGTAYTKLSNGTVVEIGGSGGDSTGAGMVISETEPVDKVDGMQWMEASTGLVFIWDEDKWLQFPAGSEGGGSSGGYGSIGSVKAKAVGDISAGDFVQIPDQYVNSDADDVYAEAVFGLYRDMAYSDRVYDQSESYSFPLGHYKSAAVDAVKRVVYAKGINNANGNQIWIDTARFTEENEQNSAIPPEIIHEDDKYSLENTYSFQSAFDLVAIPDTNLCVMVYRTGKLTTQAQILEIDADGTIRKHDVQDLVDDGVERYWWAIDWNPVHNKLVITYKELASESLGALIGTIDIESKTVSWGNYTITVEQGNHGSSEQIHRARAICCHKQSGLMVGAFSTNATPHVLVYAMDVSGDVPVTGSPVMVNVVGGSALKGSETNLSVTYNEHDNIVALATMNQTGNSFYFTRFSCGDTVNDLSENRFSFPQTSAGNGGDLVEITYDPLTKYYIALAFQSNTAPRITCLRFEDDRVVRTGNMPMPDPTAKAAGGLVWCDWVKRAFFHFSEYSTNVGSAVAVNTKADTSNYNGSFIGCAVADTPDGAEINVAAVGSVIDVQPEKVSIDTIPRKLDAGRDYVLTRDGYVKKYFGGIESETTGPRIGYALSDNKMLLGGYRQMKQVTRSGKALPVLRKIRKAMKLNDIEFRDLLEGLGIEGDEE